MSHKLFLSPLARQDLIEQGKYLAKENMEIVDRFLAATQSTLAQIAQMPLIGSPRQYRNPRLTGIRMWPIKGFENHFIFYRIIENNVEVIRILHGARDIEGIFQE